MRQRSLTRIAYLFFCCQLFAACKAGLNPADYIRWVENKTNGLHVEIEEQGYVFDLQYTPLEYLAIREFAHDELSKTAVTEYLPKIEGLQYFTLKIATANRAEDVLKHKLSEKNEYYHRIQYFSSVMQNDLTLLDGAETLHCKLFHYQRDYNIAPYQTFLIAFPNSSKNQAPESKTLVYHDQVLGLNEVRIPIKKESLISIPTVNLD